MSDNEWRQVIGLLGEDWYERYEGCDEPPVGVSFVVLRDEWSDDGKYRTIREVRLVSASATVPPAVTEGTATVQPAVTVGTATILRCSHGKTRPHDGTWVCHMKEWGRACEQPDHCPEHD